jgi:penicillin amidase
MQYRGDLEAEWASYGADTKAIAAAFVRGVNAWVAIAREEQPEEFLLAGWKPEFWSPIDLLNRTDAFLMSGDAIDEVGRTNLSPIIADAIRRAGTPPFFIGFAAPIRHQRDTADAPVRLKPDTTDVPDPDPKMLRPGAHGQVSGTRGGLLTFSEAGRTFEHPSSRYFVHLHAPNWNVIGATRPWLPGVAVGHNERVAWAMTPLVADTQDIYAETLRAPTHTVVKDVVVVFGSKAPFDFESELTPHGVVVATDREKNVAFALRWSGTEPGAAAELASLAIDRAQTWAEFRSALARWKMPLRHAVYADTRGNVGSQAAGLIPVRRDDEWRGWMTLDELPHAFNPPGGTVTVKDERQKPAVTDGDAIFAHGFGITPAARSRFNIGPLARPRDDDSPVRGAFDPANWDRSSAVNAPGQSELPSSAHFADLAASWSRGDAFPLAFSDAAVQASAETTLTLVPRRTR